jgi:hypothetical protein
MTVLKRESVVVTTTLVRFVKQVAPLAQKRTDAAILQLSHPAGNGFAGWKHAILLYLREHMGAEYQEIIDWAGEMERVRLLLGRPRGEFPVPSTPRISTAAGIDALPAANRTLSTHDPNDVSRGYR